MNRQGFSLVEMMITVAIFGLLIHGVTSAIRQTQGVAYGELQREKARLLLEYKATQMMMGEAEDPDAIARLTATLPGAAVTTRTEGETIHLEASWQDPSGGPAQCALTVFVP